MECKHAYISDGVNYVLCDADGKVKPMTLKEAAPHMCQHQKFCQQIRKCALLPSWINCWKLRSAKSPVHTNEKEEVAVTAEPITKKSKTSKKKNEN